MSDEDGNSVRWGTYEWKDIPVQIKFGEEDPHPDKKDFRELAGIDYIRTSVRGTIRLKNIYDRVEQDKYIKEKLKLKHLEFPLHVKKVTITDVTNLNQYISIPFSCEQIVKGSGKDIAVWTGGEFNGYGDGNAVAKLPDMLKICIWISE